MNAPLTKSIAVRCDVERAFTTFTTQLDRWWPRGHRKFADSVMVLDATVGGRFVERRGDGTESALGVVVVCERPHRLVYTWTPGAITGPTTVEVRFVPDGERTVVHIAHSEGDSALGDAWGERAQLFARAWSTVLPALCAFIDAEENAP